MLYSTASAGQAPGRVRVGHQAQRHPGVQHVLVGDIGEFGVTVVVGIMTVLGLDKQVTFANGGEWLLRLDVEADFQVAYGGVQ